MRSSCEEEGVGGAATAAAAGVEGGLSRHTSGIYVCVCVVGVVGVKKSKARTPRHSDFFVLFVIVSFFFPSLQTLTVTSSLLY